MTSSLRGVGVGVGCVLMGVGLERDKKGSLSDVEGLWVQQVF